MAASDHRELVGAVEVRAAGDLGDGLFARIDQIGIDFILGGKRADAKKAVLGMQGDVHARWNVIRDERGQADAEVDVGPVYQLARNPLHDSVASVHFRGFLPSGAYPTNRQRYDIQRRTRRTKPV